MDKRQHNTLRIKKLLQRILFCATLLAWQSPGDVFAQAAKKPAKSAAATRPAAKKAGTAAKSKVTILNTYRSPKNKTRAQRKSTQFIILHTTEGGVRGALEKLSANGECHYVVNTDGKVYTIIDRTRVAYHAGVSMWNGRTGIDSCSVGIEIVGYHNKDITAAQYASLRTLLGELKSIYKIPDDRVLTHSMVAYGTPNRWQKKSHRGRKRCAMLLALPASRAKLGLKSKPEFDPDVRAKRLVDADPELSEILYRKAPVKEKAVAVEIAEVASIAEKSAGNIIGPKRSAWDIARDLYNAADTLYHFPDGTQKNGTQITNWKAMPAGTRVEIKSATENPTAAALLTIGKDGTAGEIAGDEVAVSTTFYFLADIPDKYRAGSIMTLSEIDALPAGTQMLVGYNVGGPISAKLPVFNICGLKWNSPDTYYLDAKGKLTSGDKINERNIPAGSMVFYRR